MKRITIAAVVAFLFFIYPQRSFGYLLVEDIPQLTTSIVNEVKNYAAYLQQEFNQLQQITNQITQISNEITALERFGNPNYYINLLGLDALMDSVANLENGIGQTISTYRSLTNGELALSYTANGLYSNLVGALDRFGQPVQWNMGAFRKFQTVNDMVDGYNIQQRTYNTQLAILEQQLAIAQRNLNSDGTQMGSFKWGAQVNAISAQMNALGHTTNLTGQRAQMQQVANQNDASRIQEASAQQEAQERIEDLQQEATGFEVLLGGGGNGTLP
jgi:hypothetical protein